MHWSPKGTHAHALLVQTPVQHSAAPPHVVPIGLQTQAPLVEHTFVEGHEPQVPPQPSDPHTFAPQRSAFVLHAPPQSFAGDTHSVPHSPSLHVRVAFPGAAGQGVLHFPQWSTDSWVSTQDAPHASRPDGQLVTQAPFAQSSPALQRFPHEPQFSGSSPTSMHSPAHTFRGEAQPVTPVPASDSGSAAVASESSSGNVPASASVTFSWSRSPRKAPHAGSDAARTIARVTQPCQSFTGPEHGRLPRARHSDIGSADARMARHGRH